MSDNKSVRPARARGIYLLPNMLTLTALFAGFYAIVAAQRGQFASAAMALFFAIVMDVLDGGVARLTNTQSDFGAQLDSLSDMVSFGVAPALAMYTWSLNELGKLGWLVAFIYAASVALRLARFNIHHHESDKRYSQGLPCTPAAGVVAGFIWIGADTQLYGPNFCLWVALLALYLSLAMTSNLPFRSNKGINLKENVPFVSIIVVMLALVIVATDPPKVLFVTLLAYALSGPALQLWSWSKKRWCQRQKSQ